MPGTRQAGRQSVTIILIFLAYRAEFARTFTGADLTNSYPTHGTDKNRTPTTAKQRHCH